MSTDATQAPARVCRFEEIEEGKCKTVDAWGRTIAVYKHEGQLYAVDDECPHRSGPLSLGHIEAGGVVCPLHAWIFDLKTGEKRGQSEMRVATYRVECVGDEVFVSPPEAG